LKAAGNKKTSKKKKFVSENQTKKDSNVNILFWDIIVLKEGMYQNGQSRI
jgi:hypothetical protein